MKPQIKKKQNKNTSFRRRRLTKGGLHGINLKVAQQSLRGGCDHLVSIFSIAKKKHNSHGEELRSLSFYYTN